MHFSREARKDIKRWYINHTMSDRMVYNSSKKKAGGMSFNKNRTSSLWQGWCQHIFGLLQNVPNTKACDVSKCPDFVAALSQAAHEPEAWTWVGMDRIPCVLFLLTHDGIQRLKSTILADLYFLRPVSKSKTKYLKEIRWPHLSNAYHVTLHDVLYPCNP